MERLLLLPCPSCLLNFLPCPPPPPPPQVHPCQSTGFQQKGPVLIGGILSQLLTFNHVLFAQDSAYGVFYSCLDLIRVSCPSHFAGPSVFLSRAF